MSEHVGKDWQVLLIAALIDLGSWKPAQKAHLTQEHFSQYQDIASWIEGYLKRHGKTPTRQMLETNASRIVWPTGQAEHVDALIYSVKNQWLMDKMHLAMKETINLMVSDKDTQLSLSYMSSQLQSLQVRMQDHDRDLDLATDWQFFFQEAVVRREAQINGSINGVMTGFKALDQMMGGIGSTELVTIIARQGQGKSWAMLYMAAQALLQGKKVCFLPLEMSITQVGFRLHVILQQELKKRVKESFHNIDEILNTELTTGNNDLRSYKEFLQLLESEVGGKLILTENPGKINASSIMAKMEEHQPDILFIDYLTLMESSGGQRQEGWQEIKALTQELKRLAMNQECPIVVAAQANRQASHRDGPPELTDIAFGDAIGMDSDRVISLKQHNNRITQGRLIKNRHGEGRIDFWLNTEYNRGKITPVDHERALMIIDEEKG